MAEQVNGMKIANLPGNTTMNDTDVMIVETAAPKTGKITFLNLCKAIVAKLASITTDKLETTAKTIVGAINELNSTTQKVTSTMSNKIVNISMATNCESILNLTELSCIRTGNIVHIKIDLSTKTQFVGWTTIAYNLPASFLTGNTYIQTPKAKFQVDTNGNLKMAEASEGVYIDTMISYPCK